MYCLRDLSVSFVSDESYQLGKGGNEDSDSGVREGE